MLRAKHPRNGGSVRPGADRASGRRGERLRGVSPIIATVLLVAITVVLAAVLYILVTNLTNTAKPAANVGLVFQKQVICSSSASPPSTFNVYVVTVASSTQAISSSDFGMKVVPASSSSGLAPGIGATANGGTCQVLPATGNWVAVLENSKGMAIGWFDASTSNGGWHTIGSNPFPLPLQDVASIVVISPSSVDLGLATLSLYGINGYTVSGEATL